MARSNDYADVSFEVAHLYLGDPALEETIDAYAEVAKAWAAPLIDTMRAAGKIVSVVVFLDDYSDSTGKVHAADDVRPRAIKALAKRGIEVDYVALESECAKSARLLTTQLDVPANEGAGSFVRPSTGCDVDASGEFVHYFDDKSLADFAIGRLYKLSKRSLPQRTDIGVRIRLHDPAGDDFTCPAVAAWWQLIRLGAFAGTSAAEAEQDGFTLSPTIVGAPDGTWRRQDAAPFMARRTVTLLAPIYLGVEHAVQVLLSNANLPERFRKSLGIGTQAQRPSTVLNQRISYVFADSEALRGKRQAT